MARPKKQTVDYFPHQCVHGKTLFILEKNYGNNGYAFWFKMLEMLGSTEGHCLDLNDIAVWEFLKAKTFTTEESCTEILNLLAKLDAIDNELWQEKIVWCQNFVDGISDAYSKRTVEIPIKPSLRCQKLPSTEVSGVGNPQMKVNEMKLNEMKLNNNISLPTSDLQSIIDYFNATCVSLPKVKTLTDKRKKSLQKRIDQHGIKSLKEVFDKAEQSDFLTNRPTKNNKRKPEHKNWKASFDWLLELNYFVKVLEGNYENTIEEITTSNVEVESDFDLYK